MTPQGFLRAAAATPDLVVADPAANARATVALLEQAEAQGVNLAVFPEMGLTGYTCGDLFHTLTLPRAADAALAEVAAFTGRGFHGVAVVGLPVAVGGQLFNAAAVLHNGRVLGVVPKAYLPNYKEFYDARYFSPAWNGDAREIRIGPLVAPFGTDILFRCSNWSEFIVGVEICEDLWTPIPPSSRQALRGATVLVNLSASNEAIGKSAYRKQLVSCQSGRCMAGYISYSARCPRTRIAGVQ